MSKDERETTRGEERKRLREQERVNKSERENEKEREGVRLEEEREDHVRGFQSNEFRNSE